MAVLSKATTLVRRFLYRLPRFKTEIPMDLIVGDSVILGMCVNISESGLRGTFSHTVATGAEGLLTLYHGGQDVQVHVRIDSTRNDEARVRFCFASDQERDNIRQLLTRLAPSARSPSN